MFRLMVRLTRGIHLFAAFALAGGDVAAQGPDAWRPQTVPLFGASYSPDMGLLLGAGAQPRERAAPEGGPPRGATRAGPRPRAPPPGRTGPAALGVRPVPRAKGRPRSHDPPVV